ncbi:MAG TPA: SusE domain-containing protein [Chitinophagaceae bacterium]|nr:SusE domain-containing protein [Chitinophagaceae bacterium]
MKYVLKYLFSPLVLIAVFASCEKDENRITLESSTPPVLTASSTTPMVLSIANVDNFALRFNWTNPQYRLTTGISSHNVTYTLEVDTAGANFSNPLKQEVSISNDLSKEFTVKELNNFFISTRLNLLENIPHNIEFRLKAAISGGAAAVYSNVIKITITPYLDTKYPVPANLYITGSATPASWQCGCNEPELLSQKFTKVNAYTFRLTIPLSANNSYLFLPVYGSWSAKYGGIGSNNTNNVNGDDFRPGGSDLKAPAVSRPYTITVDFKEGKFTVQ